MLSGARTENARRLALDLVNAARAETPRRIAAPEPRGAPLAGSGP